MGQHDTMGVTNFKDLEVWQMAHKMVLMVYEVTRAFPEDERFGLAMQMRRAAVSVPANIVEGFRRRGISDKIRHYNIAEGSLEELKYFLILAQDLNYASTTELTILADTVGRLLNGLIRSTERRQ